MPTLAEADTHNASIVPRRMPTLPACQYALYAYALYAYALYAYALYAYALYAYALYAYALYAHTSRTLQP
jgi:hypothetical protein